MDLILKGFLYKSWKNIFIKNSKNILIPYRGWNYAFNYDSKYFSNLITKRKKKSYEYKVEPKDLKLELLELENMNRSTNLELSPIDNSQINIIGCGPVGMAASLWLKKLYPNKNITIFENRTNLKLNKIHPFSRRWLTFIKLDLLEPILNKKDISIFKKVGIYNYIGVDIRTIEYSLLRAIRENGIRISTIKNEIPKPEIIVDASGGKFIKHNQSEIKKKLLAKRTILPNQKNIFGQKETSLDQFDQFEIIDFGSIMKPFYNGKPLQIPYLKINFLPPRLKHDFIYFSNKLNNDYGVYYWDGVMRNDINHSLLFISLYSSEFNLIDNLIDYPLRLDQAWDDNKFKDKVSKRLSIIFEWILSKLKREEMCYLEPLFLWQPFLCLRKEMYISGDIEYINIGDSHYIGNPKVGNGLANHLHELKNIFSAVSVSNLIK